MQTVSPWDGCGSMVHFPNMHNSLYYINLYPVLTGNNSLVALLFFKKNGYS